MKRNQKGSNNLLIIIVVIVVLAIAGFYLLKGKSNAPTYQTSTNQIIQSDSDLQSTSQDLENTDIDATLK